MSPYKGAARLVLAWLRSLCSAWLRLVWPGLACFGLVGLGWLAWPGLLGSAPALACVKAYDSPFQTDRASSSMGAGGCNTLFLRNGGGEGGVGGAVSSPSCEHPVCMVHKHI